MATIITVHGTFAKPTEANADGGPPADLQWWEAQSAFETDLHQLVEGRDGKLTVTPFVWSGDNSEVERREAGAKLASLMRELETRSEPYCVIGHSHGGSVVSSALLECASRKKALPNLKRWITVGTPFVSLKREHFLFARLDLIRKVAFVASFALAGCWLPERATAPRPRRASMAAGDRPTPVTSGGSLPGSPQSRR